MAFTREALFLKWSTGTTKRAFKVLQGGYQGGDKPKMATYARSLYDNSLLIVRPGSTKRKFTGMIVGTDTASGTANDGSENINWGTIAELEAAWAATDLEAKSFEDSSYFSCEFTMDWMPQLTYDPVRRYAAVPVTLEEK